MKKKRTTRTTSSEKSDQKITKKIEKSRREWEKKETIKPDLNSRIRESLGFLAYIIFWGIPTSILAGILLYLAYRVWNIAVEENLLGIIVIIVTIFYILKRR